jgi:hypothetical protein
MSWPSMMILFTILVLGSSYSTFVISLSYFSAIRAIERETILSFKGLKQVAPWAIMLAVSVVFLIAMVENITAVTNTQYFVVFAWTTMVIFRVLLLAFFIAAYIRAIRLLQKKAADSNFPQLAAIRGVSKMMKNLVCLGTLNISIIICMVVMGSGTWKRNYGFVVLKVMIVLIGFTGLYEIYMIPTPPKGMKTLKMRDTHSNEDDELENTGQANKMKISPKVANFEGPTAHALKEKLVERVESSKEVTELPQVTERKTDG